jgi:hypothetical protein
MPKLILRSACVGIAAVAVAGFVALFIGISLLAMNTPSCAQTGGCDSFFISAHFYPWRLLVAVLIIFTIGFLLAFRYFYKRQSAQDDQP